MRIRRPLRSNSLITFLLIHEKLACVVHILTFIDHGPSPHWYYFLWCQRSGV